MPLGQQQPVILILDDAREIADFVAAGLTANGHQALALYTPKDAIEHAGMLKFDAALVGFRMPGLLGTEVAVRIKALSPETKIVIMVEEVPPEVAASLRRREFDFDYLPAPFDWNELKGLLKPNSFLEDSNAHGEAESEAPQKPIVDRLFSYDPSDGL